MQSFNITPFFFSRYQTKCVITFLFIVDDVISFKIYLQSTSKVMPDRKKKGERRKYKNYNILRMKRAFQMKQKTFFTF